MTNHRTARAERIVDVVLAEFGQAVIGKISMRDAMVAACAAALIDRERQPDETLKRCAVCGFVVDPNFAADKPTVRMRP